MTLDSLTSLLRAHGYWLLVPLSFIEGPGVAFVAGTLSSLGFFNPFIVFGLFVAKDLVVDSFFYGFGRLGRNRRVVANLLAKGRVTAGELGHIRGLWDRHSWGAMWVAKLSWGVSPALLAVAGIAAVPVATFVSRAFGVAVVQYGLLLPLGYYLGHTIHTVSVAIRLVGYVAAGAVLVALVYGRRRLRDKAKRS
jgi:membrane protein DedA with SNARE-associated domain